MAERGRQFARLTAGVETPGGETPPAYDAVVE